METRTTKVRKGSIDGIDLIFSITAKFNNTHICGAEGVFPEPSDLYQKFFGVDKILIDKETLLKFEIFISEKRFIFSSYANIEKLF